MFEVSRLHLWTSGGTVGYNSYRRSIEQTFDRPSEQSGSQ